MNIKRFFKDDYWSCFVFSIAMIEFLFKTVIVLSIFLDIIFAIFTILICVSDLDNSYTVSGSSEFCDAINDIQSSTYDNGYILILPDDTFELFEYDKYEDYHLLSIIDTNKDIVIVLGMNTALRPCESWLTLDHPDANVTIYGSPHFVTLSDLEWYISMDMYDPSMKTRFAPVTTTDLITYPPKWILSFLFGSMIFGDDSCFSVIDGNLVLKNITIINTFLLEHNDIVLELD